jgi:hypothetical protein
MLLEMLPALLLLAARAALAAPAAAATQLRITFSPNADELRHRDREGVTTRSKDSPPKKSLE